MDDSPDFVDLILLTLDGTSAQSPSSCLGLHSRGFPWSLRNFLGNSATIKNYHEMRKRYIPNCSRI